MPSSGSMFMQANSSMFPAAPNMHFKTNRTNRVFSSSPRPPRWVDFFRKSEDLSYPERPQHHRLPMSSNVSCRSLQNTTIGLAARRKMPQWEFTFFNVLLSLNGRFPDGLSANSG